MLNDPTDVDMPQNNPSIQATSPIVDVIAQLGFDLPYFEDVVQHFSQFASEMTRHRDSSTPI